MDGTNPARWHASVRHAIPAADDALIEEVAQHVAERWTRARAGGLPEIEADRLVQRELDEWRAVRMPPRAPRWRAAALTAGWAADARYAARSLAIRPPFTMAATLLSAVAVTANVGAFAVAYGILWRPLPYPQADRLTAVWQFERGEQGQVAYPDYRDLAASGAFESASAITGGRGSIRVGDTIERVNGIAMEPAGFAMLGATPWMGRLLHEGDDQSSLLISHRLWKTHLNEDPAIIGKPLWLSGRDHTIVGVLPPGFDFELPVGTFKMEKHDVWRRFDMSSPFIERRDVTTFQVLATLAPNTSIEAAQAAAEAVGTRLSATHPGTNANRSFRVVALRSHVVAGVRRPLLLACAAAAAALLIALANLITLALVRTTDRQGELSVRSALGAGRLRLRRQLFTEHAVIVAAGSLLGYLLAVYLVTTLAASEVAQLPRPDAIRFDRPVQLFAAALALLLALLLTILPVRFGDGFTSLRAGTRGSSRAGRRSRQTLVAAELAIAIALTAGGALLALSVTRLFDTNPGFAPGGVLGVRISAYQARYPSKERVQAFFDTTLDRIRELPEVGAAAAGSSLPLSGQNTGTGVVVEGRPVPAAARQVAGWEFVTPGYFAALGMPLRGGRDFTAQDRAHDTHVTVVNETLARALFGSDDPIGRRVAYGDGDRTGDWHQIVGVVGDVRHHALDADPTPRAYDLFGQHWGRTLYVVVRSRSSDAAATLPAVRSTVRQLDAEAPVFEAATMTSLIERSGAPYRLSAGLAAGLALASVVLALIGIYAVAAASVSERTREIGIRAALGASPRSLLAMVVREGAWTGLAGTAAGIVGAAAAARLLGAQLFGIDAGDTAILIPTVSALALVVALGATLPAGRRAARADPLAAMRVE